jgi:hypothetical protein
LVVLVAHAETSQAKGALAHHPSVAAHLAPAAHAELAHTAHAAEILAAHS